MQYVYLASGFLGVLKSIIDTIMNTVFIPIINDILQIAFSWLGSLVTDIFGEIFFTILIGLVTIVDFIAGIFDIFSGATAVKYGEESMSILDAMFALDGIKRGFLLITFLAVVMSITFTIIATAKSMSDMAIEDKNPLSKVLSNAMRSGVTFLLIPFMCLFMLQLCTVATNGVTTAFSASTGGKQQSVGSMIFLTASLNAGKDKSGNLIKEANFKEDPWASYVSGSKSYQNVNQVKKDFNVKKFDFVTGVVCCFVMLLILLGATVMFITRIFELLLLYVVSPFFASTIPLDDGAMFRKWRDMFVAKFFAGFGTIFVMRMYLTLIPEFMSSSMKLFEGNTAVDSILKIFFVIGGAWAVYKGQQLFLQIFHPEAAAAAAQSSVMMAGMAMGAVGGAGRMMTSRLSGDGGGKSGGRKKSDSKQASYQTSDQAFRGR